MYLSTICFICLLALTLINTWKFLIKQKRYKNRSLLMFYIYTVMLALMRIYFSFFFFYIFLEYELFGILVKPILKLDIGVIQCWVLIELALKVTLNIRVVESS